MVYGEDIVVDVGLQWVAVSVQYGGCVSERGGWREEEDEEKKGGGWGEKVRSHFFVVQSFFLTLI